MEIKKIKEVYKIHSNAVGYLQRIRALLTILDDNGNADYPSNFLYTIALRDIKSVIKNICKSEDVLSSLIRIHKL